MTNTNTRKRRILSALLAVVMALSLLPMAAFATEPELLDGTGTKNDPYLITTADQLAAIKDDLTGYYKLDNDIVLTGTWTPIGTFDPEADGETPKAAEAFTGTFDGDGHTISGLTVDGDIAAGLFGCVANGTVKNVTIENATVSGGCMVAAAVGYAYNSTVEDVTLTASEGETNAITGHSFDYYGTQAAPNMMAGIVGAGMDSTVTGCKVEKTTLTATGFGNADGWGTNVHDIGLLGGGLENTSLSDCTVQDSSIEITGPSAFGVGGLSGCAMVADSVTNCTVNNVSIKMDDNAYLVGGLVGYDGKTDGDVTELTDCTTENVKINVGATSYRIGGLIGGGFYLPIYQSYFPVPTAFSVTDPTVSGVTITTGTNSAALGLVAGQGYQSTIIGANASGKINGTDSTMVCGAPEDENSTFLYDLSATYQPLFEGATFESKYDHYWNDYAAAVVGAEAAAEMDAAGMMKASIGVAWADKDKGDNFCCQFTNNVATLTFQGSVITGYDADDNVVFSHAYKYLRDGHLYGPDPEDTTKQIPYMDLTIYESLDGNTDEFRYFAMCGDTPDTTYHIEFRYGSDLDALEQMYTGAYGHWLAAGIPTDADETMYSNVIALFCAENLSSMTTEETKTQRDPLVGTWLPEDADADLLVFGEDGTVNGSEGSAFYAYDGNLITVLDDVCTGYRYTLEGDKLTLKTVDEKTVLGTYTKWDGYYTVSVRDGIDGGSVEVKDGVVKARPGDTVTFTATPDDGYTAANVGYWTVDRSGKEGKLNTLTADKDGVYSFTMPESNVVIGASFQSSEFFITVGSSSSSGLINGSKEKNCYIYASNEHAYLPTENAQPSARLFVDTRLLEKDDVTMTLETREYSSGGYKIVGSKEFTHAEMVAFFTGTGVKEGATTYNTQNVTYKRLDDAKFPEVKSLTEGNKVYMVAKFGRPEWTNAKGDATYRWTSTEDSTVTADVSKAPQPIVWLYNLTESSHRGAIVRGILKDLNIPIGTIDGSTLDENIGYLVRWEGYESTNPAYNTNSYDVEYILMGNLAETQMDDFLDGMSQQNIRVNLKSVPTAWTAGKTFSELFAIMAEEDEAFKAILALDSMIYDAEQLDEETYSGKPGWDAFQTALAKANAILQGEEELEAQEYLAASEALKQAYLKITGKTALTGDLALTLTKQEDGTYQISAELENGPSGAQFSYAWQNNTSGKTLDNWSKDALRQVKLTITGTGSFYGTLSATLSVPTVTYRTSATTGSITVAVDELPATRNMPAPTGYVVQLYQGDTLIAERTSETAGSFTFSDLSRGTTYTVKLYAENVVGRSDILTQDVTTRSGSSGGGSGTLTYAVDVSDELENGSVRVSTKNAAQGSTVTVTVTPDSGYALDRLTVTDAKGAAVAVTALGDGKYTFTMPAAQVTVQASFTRSAPATVGGFTDVAADAYYADAVLWAVEQGVTSGTTATTFAPAAACTRAQMVTFLWRAAGSPKAERSAVPFTDVAADAYYYDAVLWAVEQGITTGTTATTFDPGAVVSRGQTVTFLYRAAGAPAVAASGTFTDVPADAYYADAVAWAVARGITNGVTATTFGPNSACTRAQIVTFLYRDDQAK